MLPKIHRLQKTKEIERVFKKGKGVKEDFLILKTTKNDLGKTRFGFVVSQKVSKKANIRNKIKRRLRVVAEKSLKGVEKGRDCLFIALPGMEKKDFREIEKTVERLLKKGG